jgi:hypothetical protein
MKTITLALLAAAAIGAASTGSASAMPINNLSAASGEGLVQDVRLVCDHNRRCYNTGRSYRYARPMYEERYGSPGYYSEPSYGYGNGYYGGGYGGYYGGGPGVGIGVGPFGFRVR